MAEPAEPPAIPTHPVPPAQENPISSVSSKRRREDSDAASGEASSGAPSPKRREKTAMDIIFRVVVPSRQIGKVIGRVGTRIQKIREETKATIKIADAISRNEERVIIISSKDSDNQISDAENALCQVAGLILKDDDAFLPPKVDAVHVAANTLRLLIAGSQAGSLIGVSGQNIEKLRISSGASITILAPSRLPICASAHESDRVVQISGDVSAVMKALGEIGMQLRDNPPRQVIALNPTYSLGFNRQPPQQVGQNSADYVSLVMMISEAMIGGLIGRCGSNISRIRTASGAAIKVHGGKGTQKHRQIQLGGSAQQVALAKQCIDEYIYNQTIQQSGAEQSVDLVTGVISGVPPFYALSNQVSAYPPSMPYGAPPQ